MRGTSRCLRRGKRAESCGREGTGKKRKITREEKKEEERMRGAGEQD